jgi:16S rRNA (guanine966-N2)-methyltransferase
MRIVGGDWRGRPIKAPRGNATRPTTDRVREALFSALVARLGSDLGAGSVLDAFAGSGALGLEALSRGAAAVTFVERDRSALLALRHNVEALDAAKRTRIVVGNAFSLAKRPFPGSPFSLILLDPPYTLDPAEVAALLSGLVETGGIRQGATVSWEHASGVEPTWPHGFHGIDRKRYGTTEIDVGVYERGV